MLLHSRIPRTMGDTGYPQIPVPELGVSFSKFAKFSDLNGELFCIDTKLQRQG